MKQCKIVDTAWLQLCILHIKCIFIKDRASLLEEGAKFWSGGTIYDNKGIWLPGFYAYFLENIAAGGCRDVYHKAYTNHVLIVRKVVYSR